MKPDTRRSRFKFPPLPEAEPLCLGYNCDVDASPFFPRSSVFLNPSNSRGLDSEPVDSQHQPIRTFTERGGKIVEVQIK